MLCCEISDARAGCMRMVCSMQQCVLDPRVSRELEAGARSGLYSWTPGNYSTMWGLTLLQFITNNLNTVKPSTDQLMSPVQFSYSASSLPASFQSSSRWSGLISPPGPVTRCSPGWAVSAVSVLSDRLSLARGRRVELESFSLGCDRGSVSQAGLK